MTISKLRGHLPPWWQGNRTSGRIAIIKLASIAGIAGLADLAAKQVENELGKS